MQPFFHRIFIEIGIFKGTNFGFFVIFLSFFFLPSLYFTPLCTKLPKKIPNSRGFFFFPDGFLQDSHQGEFKSLEKSLGKRGFLTQKKA